MNKLAKIIGSYSKILTNARAPEHGVGKIQVGKGVERHTYRKGLREICGGKG